MKRISFLLAATIAIASPVAAQQSTPPAHAHFAVGPQYDTTHVYVPVADFDQFVSSFAATFGGKPNPGGTFQVTPTPSKTRSQLVITPAGTVSVFGFVTPIPAPFGEERVGYLVNDMDGAVAAARAAGAERVVETFPDPIGRDTLVRWPGGSVMQLYWHTKAPSYPAPQTIPENRIYMTGDSADRFVAAWRRFANARLISDKQMPGDALGQPGKAWREIRLESGYGKTTVLVTDGALVWPYGREKTGYAVPDLDATLEKAKTAGVTLLVAPHVAGERRSAMVEFPGGYIAEIHESAKG
ncbi:MAG: glyoxalase [Sphingomonas sp.]|nr:glyoxalase [Sphingomonas sp.]